MSTTAPVPVGGLFETHLTVSDLGRSVAFYRDVVGLSVALEDTERGAAFLWIGEPGEAMLGLWLLGSAPIGLSLHVAFTASLDDVLGACDRLRSLDVTPLSFFATETTRAERHRLDAGRRRVLSRSGRAPPRVPDDARRASSISGVGILPWSQWTAGNGLAPLDPAGVHVDIYTGPRVELRPLFAMAEDSTAQLDSYLDAGQVLVAVAGDRVVGHLQLVDDDDAQHCEIKNMAVEPSFRGRGVGRTLIEAAVDLVRAQRRSMLVVATAAADIDNLRFYQRTGFRIRSVERDAFTPGNGYPPHTSLDGIELRDRVWLDLCVRGQ